MNLDHANLLERLLDVTCNLGDSVNVDSYLQTVLSAAVELTGSESASLLDYDESSQEFSFKFVPWFHREPVTNAKVPLQGSVAGWVFQNKKPLAVNDVSTDGRHYKKIDELTGLITRSILGVPILARGNPIGVFEVFNKRSRYTDADVRVMESLASLASATLQIDLLENRILSAQEEARELDRLKNEFIAITSHELRTPLGLILGYGTFLKELLDEQYDEQVDAIIRNASRLKEIIESLSSVNNYEKGGALVRSRRVSVSRIIEDVAISFNEMAQKKNIALDIEKEMGSDFWVDIDASKIAIVLSNLIKNAITFTDEGGRIVIRAEQETDYVQVSVVDNGLGIPAKDLPHIFDRFYQVESHLTRKHGGMGLGLSVAKVMVEMHGGRIWAESMQGAGSTFTFLLPVNPQKEKQETSKPFVE
jgi:signal transduction histidine kinase